jgi:serine/threonine protein kinase/tetratricopeptide (TPR) repeat protein
MSKLSPDQWREVSPYLDQALAFTEEGRASWLVSLGERNPDLAKSLQALLEEHNALTQEGFLERELTGLPVEPGLAGRRIGTYTLVSPIGQGGMGAVWLAERSDGRFERRVAVKFISLGLVGHGAEERFKREGSILGRLTHPHIANLIDAGVSPDGQPYLVLEHVEGEHIDEYCDRHLLEVEARVRLFLDVLAAVAHAHANLIVHRDLKPSNVLVRNDGQLKLLDFGIAKLMEERDAAATALTHQAGGVLTPAYAAPEQITGGPITTATDVYALGVVLYVLLTGQHPAGCGTPSPADLVKAIVENESPRPSDVVTSARTEAQLISGNAAKRGSTSVKLRRQLLGDLDTIVGKALKKNPQERYTSVTAFADDLQRYLKHEPISARPDTLAYRARKFVRRNRLSVGIGTLALAAVVGASGMAVYQARVSQQRFQDVRKLAHTFVFDLHDEVAKLEGSTKAREMMVQTGLDNLSRNAGRDPELQKEIAAAYVKMGDAEGFPTKPNLGRTTDALVSYQKAGDIYRNISAQNPTYLPDLAKYYLDYAGLVRFTDLKKARDLAELAIETFERIQSQHPLDDNLELAYGRSWCTLDDMDEDIGHYRAAWTDVSRCSSIAHTDAEKARNNETLTLLSAADERVGTVAAKVGLLDDALRALDEDESVLNELLTAEPQNPRLHRQLALVYEFRAGVYYDDTVPSLGDAKQGLQSAQRYLELARQAAQSDLANRAAKFSEAAALLQTSIPLREFDPPAAVRMTEESVRLFDEMIASGKPNYLVSSRRVHALLRLGEAQLKARQFAEARRTAELALDGERAIVHATAADADERVFQVLMLTLAGHAKVANGEIPQGESLLLQARDEAAQVAESSELADLVPLTNAEKALGDFYASRARTDEARSCYQRVVQLWDRFPETNDYVARQRVASKKLLASLR